MAVNRIIFKSYSSFVKNFTGTVTAGTFTFVEYDQFGTYPILSPNNIWESKLMINAIGSSFPSSAANANTLFNLTTGLVGDQITQQVGTNTIILTATQCAHIGSASLGDIITIEIKRFKATSFYNYIFDHFIGDLVLTQPDAAVAVGINLDQNIQPVNMVQNSIPTTKVDEGIGVSVFSTSQPDINITVT